MERRNTGDRVDELAIDEELGELDLWYLEAISIAVSSHLSSFFSREREPREREYRL